jgi:PAS domain S-box-containing protein
MSDRSPEAIRVLHVDDDPDFLEVAETLLARAPGEFEVETASSGPAALERLAEDDVDCVVSDYEMPRLNGLELLGAVRERWPDLPFVLFTGKGSEAVASEAISAGVTDYLQKRSELEQFELLAHRIENAVGQRRAERSAATARSRMRELSETNNDSLWMFSADWEETLFVNSAYEDVFGRPAEQLREDPEDFLESVHPDDRPAVREAMTQLSDGQSVDLEFRADPEAKDWRWVWVQGEPITDGDGDVVRVAGFARDVTRRKERELAYREEKLFVDQALDALDDVFYVLDNDARLQRWNRAARDVLGYSDDEIDGAHATTFFPEDEHETLGKAIERIMETGHASMEADLLDADGNRIPYEFIGARLTDPDGEVTGLVGIGRDISDRRERERELRRQNERLEEFASVVSHDLRNPLAVAQGKLELGREEADNEYFADVAAAHERMATMIDDLLALAREGKTIEGVEAVELSPVAGRCWENVTTAEATLENDVEYTFEADPGRLKQLLENLLRNAITHAGPDVTVTVGTLSTAEGFFVADDGPGIPPDEREDVFEPGYSHLEDGTGFGLSIVRRIVHAHDWSIEATESEAGGARFEVRGVEPAGSPSAE